jgi:hypothetical protein
VEPLVALRYVALVELREQVMLIALVVPVILEFLASEALLYLAQFAVDQLALVELRSLHRLVVVALPEELPA